MPPDNLPARRDDDAPVKVDLSKPLADMDEAMRLADQLSRSDLVPNSLRGRPANILHVLMAGQTLGLDWPTSLRVIFSPGPGQIGLRGQFLLAKLREAGHDYEWKEEEDACTFIVHRDFRDEKPGRTYEATFTLEDAIAAGLAQRKPDGTVVALSRDGKPLPWQAYRKNMLFWRAVALCINRAAPEVGLGFEIQGAEGPREPEPEIQLSPQSPAPPAAGEAAPGGGAAQADAARERLAALNRDMGGAEPEELPAVIPPPARPRQAERSKVVRLEAQLATQFTELGWDPGTEHRADILRACSLFARRPVLTVRDLTEDEMDLLGTELNSIIDREPAEAYEVILAERAEAWREKWRDSDDEGLDLYETGA
jgi:hypothetical protein